MSDELPEAQVRALAFEAKVTLPVVLPRLPATLRGLKRMLPDFPTTALVAAVALGQLEGRIDHHLDHRGRWTRTTNEEELT